MPFITSITHAHSHELFIIAASRSLGFIRRLTGYLQWKSSAGPQTPAFRSKERLPKAFFQPHLDITHISRTPDKMDGSNGFTSVNANTFSPPDKEAVPEAAAAPTPEVTTGTKRKRESSKPSSKFYAVRVGKEPGIYHSWPECLDQVRGFPKAAFKSFATQTEAEAFINNQDGNTGGGRNGAKGESKFYGVQVGRTPGVYETWPEVLQQITGWRAPKHKVFKTRAEAELFVAEGQYQSRGYSTAYGTNGDSGPVQSIEPTDTGDTPNKKSKTLKGKKSGIKDENSSPSPELNGEYPPGEAPLPPDTQDDFDPTITLDQSIGDIRYKNAVEFAKTKLMASAPIPSAPVRIYTDGSSLNNGQIGANGGVGVWFGPLDKRNISEPLTGTKQTNQRAELTALLRALEVGPKDRKLDIVTDSNYAIKCVTEWNIKWRSNGWLNSSNKPVENKDLVQKLVEALEERFRLNSYRLGDDDELEKRRAEKVGQPWNWGPCGVKFTWVKGHDKDEGNNEADRLAVYGAKAAREMDDDLDADN